MGREIEIPKEFRPPKCSSYLDGLTNRDVPPEWLKYIDKMIKVDPGNVIFPPFLIKMHGKSGVKIGLK